MQQKAANGEQNVNTRTSQNADIDTFADKVANSKTSTKTKTATDKAAKGDTNDADVLALATLKRTANEANLNLANFNISTEASGSIDHRFFSQAGRDDMKKDILTLTDTLLNHMPKAKEVVVLPNGSVETKTNWLGTTLNFLGTVTGGLVPSEANNGGIFAQIGATIVADPKFEVGGNEESDKAYVNGIMTSKDNAQWQENYMVGGGKIYYNPSRGLLPDLIESAVDMFGGTSGIAKQVGYEIQQNPNEKVLGHSQGSLILNSAVKHYGLNGDNMVYAGTPLYIVYDNGVTISSPLDPVHNPAVLLNPEGWRTDRYRGVPIFIYEHANSPLYKNAINKAKK